MVSLVNQTKGLEEKGNDQEVKKVLQLYNKL